MPIMISHKWPPARTLPALHCHTNALRSHLACQSSPLNGAILSHPRYLKLFPDDPPSDPERPSAPSPGAPRRRSPGSGAPRQRVGGKPAPRPTNPATAAERLAASRHDRAVPGRDSGTSGHDRSTSDQDSGGRAGGARAAKPACERCSSAERVVTAGAWMAQMAPISASPTVYIGIADGLYRHRRRHS